MSIAAAAPPLVAQAPTPEEIIESERRLDQIRREREDLRNEMTQIRSRVTDLSSEVSNLERQVTAAAGLIGELDYLVAQREQQIQDNTYELLMTRDRLAELRAVLYRRLRDIYKRGALGTLEVLLAADSFSELLNRYRYLNLVARYDRQLAQEVAGLEQLLVARERALRSNLNQLAQARTERTSEHGQLAALQQRQRLALTSVRSQASVTEERIAQLARDEANIGALLTGLERRRLGVEAGGVATGPVTAGPASGGGAAGATLGPGRMGTLDWPLEGRLLYSFGRATQANGTALRWNGIGIGAPEGSPVAAVEAGTVVLAGPFEGYGPTVVLSHGGGYYTLYLYLREVAVLEGQPVARGATIGTVGGQPSGEGPHIEFQLRLPGGQAADPLTWLRRP